MPIHKIHIGNNLFLEIFRFYFADKVIACEVVNLDGVRDIYMFYMDIAVYATRDYDPQQIAAKLKKAIKAKRTIRIKSTLKHRMLENDRSTKLFGEFIRDRKHTMFPYSCHIKSIRRE